MGQLAVRAYRSWEELRPLRERLDALNLASRRPSPFNGWAFLNAFTRHDEMPDPSQELLVLVAFEGETLTGYLPLRSYRERLWGREQTRIGLLNWREMDRPQAVARTDDEVAVCAAFYRFLAEEVPGWNFLELVLQDSESGLVAPEAIDLRGFYVRPMPSLLRYGVVLPWRDLGGYWSSALSANQRSNVGRSCRKLLAAGRVEFVSSSDGPARLPLLDLFLDLERRSWQAHGGANVGRRPQRIAMFQELIAPQHGLDARFHFVLLDGVPVAGMFTLSFAGTDHMIGVVFDGAYEHLAPGNLVMLLGVKDAIERGAREFNFGYGGGHYKTRWGGVETPTQAVQVIRWGNVYHLKAKVGELKRRLRPPPPPPSSNIRRRESEAAHPPPAAGTPRNQELQLASRTLGELARVGARIQRLEGEALAAALPFSRGSKG